MTRNDAIKLLTRILPFNGSDEDYESKWDGSLLFPELGTTISSIDILIKLVDEEIAEDLFLDAVDPDTGETALVEVELSPLGNTYSTPTPTGLNLQLMEAIYTLVEERA